MDYKECVEELRQWALDKVGSHSMSSMAEEWYDELHGREVLDIISKHEAMTDTNAEMPCLPSKTGQI